MNKKKYSARRAYKLNAYFNKHSEIWMFYLNSTNFGALPIKNTIPAPYGKYTTQGMRKMLDDLPHVLDKLVSTDIDATKIIYEEHKEGKAKTAIGELYITNIATVGTLATGTDAVYLVRNGKVYNLDQWVELE